MLFARMHQPDKADAEFRTSLRLAPHDPDVVNNYAVYCARTVAPDEGVRRFEEARITRCIAPPRRLTPTPECVCAPRSATMKRAATSAAPQVRPNFAERRTS